MKQSDKEALKEALMVIGVTAALIFAAGIIALVALAVMQYSPIAAAAISIVFVLILGGIVIFFVER
jgi:hypothetical protein